MPKPGLDNQYRVGGLSAEELDEIVKQIRAKGADIEIERDTSSGRPTVQHPPMFSGAGPEFTVIADHPSLLEELKQRSGVTAANCMEPLK